MKINWFSPLPPARSDIARVTRGLLPLLAEQAEIVIWSSAPEWSQEVEKFGEVHYYDPDNLPWHKINQADVTIYLIGNDPKYHGAIWAVSRQHPGIVVMHDLKLQDFFLVLAQQNRFINKDDYLRMTAFHYGNAGRKLAESYLRRTISLAELADHYSLVEFVTENALAVVVHSQAGYDNLADDASLPVAYIPLCVCGPMPGIDLDRRTEVATNEPYRIIIFGFLGLNRRVDAFLKTFAEFPQRSHFRLDVYGTSQTEEITQHLICELELEESVKMHGFVGEDTLDAALRQSDLAINLRYPTMGEASGSQLVIWQYGLPSLVTRIGWYATLPDETAGFVRFDHERDDIHAHLSDFLAEPERYREMGRNGRRYIEEQHTREGYVNLLLELANSVSDSQAIWSTRNLSNRVGATMRGWCDETTADTLSCGVAREIQILSGRSGPDESRSSLSSGSTPKPMGKVTALATLERRLGEMEHEITAMRLHFENARQLPSDLAGMERRLEDLQHEQRDRIEQLLAEQRVCFKQLTLAHNEEAGLADHARRSAELRLEELGRRLEELRASVSR